MTGDLLIAGDIGGTKTNLAIFSMYKKLIDPLAEETFQTRNYPSFESIVRAFLSSANFKVNSASFAVAGPIVHEKLLIGAKSTCPPSDGCAR